MVFALPHSPCLPCSCPVIIPPTAAFDVGAPFSNASLHGSPISPSPYWRRPLSRTALLSGFPVPESLFFCTADNRTDGRIHGMNPHGEGVRNSVWEGIYPNSPAERNEKSSDRLMMM